MTSSINPEVNHKQTADIYNMIISENIMVKQKYNELLEKYNTLCAENMRLQTMLTDSSNNTVSTGNSEVVSYLQSKNSELMKALAEKTQALAESEKATPVHKPPYHPPPHPIPPHFYPPPAGKASPLMPHPMPHPPMPHPPMPATTQEGKSNHDGDQEKRLFDHGYGYGYPWGYGGYSYPYYSYPYYPYC